MKEIEIIPLARRKMERRGVSESWVSEALRYASRSLKDTGVVRLRKSGAELVGGKSFFGLFSKRLKINTW